MLNARLLSPERKLYLITTCGKMGGDELACQATGELGVLCLVSYHYININYMFKGLVYCGYRKCRQWSREKRQTRLLNLSCPDQWPWIVVMPNTREPQHAEGMFKCITSHVECLHGYKLQPWHQVTHKSDLSTPTDGSCQSVPVSKGCGHQRGWEC